MGENVYVLIGSGQEHKEGGATAYTYVFLKMPKKTYEAIIKLQKETMAGKPELSETGQALRIEKLNAQAQKAYGTFLNSKPERPVLSFSKPATRKYGKGWIELMPNDVFSEHAFQQLSKKAQAESFQPTADANAANKRLAVR